jgi:hypothetical protein
MIAAIIEACDLVKRLDGFTAVDHILQDKIGYSLKRPNGRPPQEVRRYYSSFSYQAGSWSKPRRVVAKVEWHPLSACRLYRH